MNNTFWYLDKSTLGEAIGIVREYAVCYPYNVFLKEKTPCMNFKEDLEIPVGLTEAIEVYLDELSDKDYKELANQVAFEAGEFYRIRRTAIVKLLTRILADGFPDKDLIRKSLILQIEHRKQLLIQL